MRKLFDDMPEELKAMLGLDKESSPHRFKGWK
jgi:hypothetical protein